MKLIIVITSVVLFLDQIIKILVSTLITINSNISIIDNFFSLTYVRNYGAAFSILNGNTLFLILISLLSLFLIYHFLLKGKQLKKIEMITYGLLIGGLLGNLLDRIIFGYVTDYLSFKIFNYDFPVFNLADTCIVLATVSLIFILGSDTNDNKSRKLK